MNINPKSRPDLYLFVSLLLALALFSVLKHGEPDRLVLGGLVYLAILLAIWKLSNSRVWARPVAVLMSAAMIATVASGLFKQPVLLTIKWGSLSAFFGLVVVGLFSYSRVDRAILDTRLLTAFSIYALTGMFLFALFSAVDVMHPGFLRLTRDRPAWVQVVFVSFLAAAAWSRPLDRSRRWVVTKLAVVAISAVLLAHFANQRLSHRSSSVVWEWLPYVLLLFPYWQVGQFFTVADPHAEQRLAAFDTSLFRSLGINPSTMPISLAAGAFLELAYLLVYPLVPLSIVTLYLSGLRHHIGYFWMVVLLANYASVVITPFVQAMPPRLLSGYNKFKPPTSGLRRFNEWILRQAGIQAVTFPSAHVASAFAIALVLLRLEPWVGLIFLLIAISIAIATVTGGYHYAADVLLALLVALVIFTVTFRVLSPA